VKPHTVFLRNGSIVPDHCDLRLEPFSKGWAEVMGVLVSELDASIRNSGWHFMWITDSHSSRGLGRTPEAAIRRAVVSAFKEVQGRFNAAEMGSFQITKCLGLHIAKVTLHARHIQKQASLDSDAEIRLQQVLIL
jgi:hypothetical protein